jgi:hypothetical protein
MIKTAKTIAMTTIGEASADEKHEAMSMFFIWGTLLKGDTDLFDQWFKCIWDFIDGNRAVRRLMVVLKHDLLIREEMETLFIHEDYDVASIVQRIDQTNATIKHTTLVYDNLLANYHEIAEHMYKYIDSYFAEPETFLKRMCFLYTGHDELSNGNPITVAAGLTCVTNFKVLNLALSNACYVSAGIAKKIIKHNIGLTHMLANGLICTRCHKVK